MFPTWNNFYSQILHNNNVVAFLIIEIVSLGSSENIIQWINELYGIWYYWIVINIFGKHSYTMSRWNTSNNALKE